MCVCVCVCWISIRWLTSFSSQMKGSLCFVQTASRLDQQCHNQTMMTPTESHNNLATGNPVHLTCASSRPWLSDVSLSTTPKSFSRVIATVMKWSTDILYFEKLLRRNLAWTWNWCLHYCIAQSLTVESLIKWMNGQWFVEVFLCLFSKCIYPTRPTFSIKVLFVKISCALFIKIFHQNFALHSIPTIVNFFSINITTYAYKKIITEALLSGEILSANGFMLKREESKWLLLINNYTF